MLKQKLKEALKAAGLKEGLVDLINITSEDQIEGIVNSLKSTQSPEDVTPDFNKILGSQEFADYVTTNGFDKVVTLSKPLQREHDKKVTAGIKTFSDKHFKQINEENIDGMNPDGTPKTNDDMPAWAKTLIDKVDGIEKSKTTESKLEQARAVLNASKVLPDHLKKSWESRLQLESETSFEDQVKGFDAEYSETHKSIVGNNVDSGLPLGGGSDKKVSDEEVGDLVEGLGI